MGDVGIRLLGDVAVLRDREVRQTGSVRFRTLLALLALRVGDAVDGELLIDEAWGEELPDNPRPTLIRTSPRSWSVTVSSIFARTST